MIGLALQGGGARGAYQAGAIWAFKELGIKFNGVCGTSIGAFNGAMVVCKKEQELMEFWYNIDMGKILGFNTEYMKKKAKKEYNFHYYYLGILNFFQILKSKGIDIKGLEDVLKSYLKEEDIKNSPCDFGLCTVRLHSLKPLYIFKEEMLEGKIFDYILASCYLPVFKREKKVDEHYYLDGGFYDNTPINMLIEKGYKKIYIVELNPWLNINRKLKKEVEIIRISPKRSLGAFITFDLEKVREHIKMGYYDTIRVIKKLDGYDYCFKRRPNIFYKWLLRKISENEVKRIKRFFRAKNEKEIVIKSLEYILKNENVDYYAIYKPFKKIKEAQRNYTKEHFIYNFVRKLNIL